MIFPWKQTERSVPGNIGERSPKVFSAISEQWLTWCLSPKMPQETNTCSSRYWGLRTWQLTTLPKDLTGKLCSDGLYDILSILYYNLNYSGYKAITYLSSCTIIYGAWSMIWLCVTQNRWLGLQLVCYPALCRPRSSPLLCWLKHCRKQSTQPRPCTWWPNLSERKKLLLISYMMLTQWPRTSSFPSLPVCIISRKELGIHT